MNEDEISVDTNGLAIKGLKEISVKILETLSLIASELEKHDKDLKYIKDEISRISSLAQSLANFNAV
jgi:hypothetical protein